MKKLLLKIAVAIMRCIYAPMKLRKTKKMVTIISRQSNNPTLDITLLSNYFKNNYPQIECRIMCRNFESSSKLSYAFHLLSQMKNIAISKVIVLDGYCISASVLNHKPQLQIVQMWHAMAAIKEFGYQAVGKPAGRSVETANAMYMHRNYDYIIAPSIATGQLFCKAFGADESKLKLIGLPRTDVIKQGAIEKREENIILRQNVEREYGISNEQEIILYAPTFRKGGEIRAEQVINSLNSDRFRVIVKLHPFDDEKGISDTKYSTYEWFGICDRVITDYSALGVEATLLNKPLYFYVYDIKEYEETTGLNINPLIEMPGASTENIEELKLLLSKKYNFEELNKFKNKYITVDIENCTKKLGDFIYELVD